jgi:hypothetical protein
VSSRRARRPQAHFLTGGWVGKAGQSKLPSLRVTLRSEGGIGSAPGRIASAFNKAQQGGPLALGDVLLCLDPPLGLTRGLFRVLDEKPGGSRGETVKSTDDYSAGVHFAVACWLTWWDIYGTVGSHIMTVCWTCDAAPSCDHQK